jgi:MFS family permease
LSVWPSFAAASVAPAVSGHPWQIIAARAASGAGAAFIMPATLSLLTAAYPRGERIKAVGIWAGLAGSGAVVGSQTRWRMTMPLPAGLRNSHQNGRRFFSSLWRILEPYGGAVWFELSAAFGAVTPPGALSTAMRQNGLHTYMHVRPTQFNTRILPYSFTYCAATYFAVK